MPRDARLKLEPAGFFVLRSPLLPAQDERGDREAELVSRARSLLEDPHVREAVLRASPSLVRALEDETRRSDQHAAALAVYRYFERMRARSTPFGLMAGYAIGDVGDGPSEVTLAPRADYVRVVRLDAGAVAELVQKYRVEPREARALSRWSVAADRVTLPDIVRIPRRAGESVQGWTDLRRSDALDALISHAKSPRSIDDLVAELAQFAATTEDARAFIDAAIDQGLLVPEELPSRATEDELRGLRAIPELRAVGRRADQLRRTRLGDGHDAELDELRASVRAAGASSEPLLIDLWKTATRAHLARHDAALLSPLISVLLRLHRPRRDERLETFATEFLRRYEGRRVRLVEALDDLRGYDFPAQPTESAGADRRLDALRAALLHRGLQNSEHEAELTIEDLEALPDLEEPFPTHVSLAAQFGRGEHGLVVYEPFLHATAGLPWFARAGALSEELRDRVRSLLAVAPSSPSVTAELRYFVDKDAVARQFPRLYPVELAVSALSESADGARIELDDLVLSHEGRFVLRHQHTGQEVRPARAGAMITTAAPPPAAVRFLEALTNEAEFGVAWDWGALAAAPALPRVVHGGHMLAARRWNVGARRLQAVRAADTPAARRQALADLRAELGLPRHVLFDEVRDQALPVDLDDTASVAAWLDVARGDVVLREPFPVERSLVTSPEGAFAHELVIPFVVRPPRLEESRAPAPASGADDVDTVLPGGDVLYLSFGGDRQELLPILVEARDAVLGPILADGSLSHWFFLPYRQRGEPQVRLRVFGRPSALLSAVLPALRDRLEPYVRAGAIRDVCLRSYERETYRYGGPRGVDLSERVWCASSEEVLSIHAEHSVLEMDEDELVLRLAALHLELLAAAPLSLGERRDVARAAFSRYARTDDPVSLRRDATVLYRGMKNLRAQGAASAPHPASELFEQLACAARAGEVSRELSDLLPDYLHTHSLRLLTTWNRFARAEPLAYVVVEKLYASALARGA